MAVWIITGKLGGGKTLCAVGLIREALASGRKVATNIDLWVENMLPWANREAVVYRLPDKLTATSFEIIGCGNEHEVDVRGRKLYDESKNGLIVLDEGGLSMNSREYRESGRQEFIRWCVHSRKRGWDVAIIVQHFDTLDKQIRDMFGEHIVHCMRWDRISIPGLGGLLRLLGTTGRFPQVHYAVCRYGQSHDSPVAWKKAFKAADLYFAYDTRQQYYPSDDESVYQFLPPWHVKGRYEEKTELADRFAVFRETYLNVQLPRVLVFFCAMMFGAFVHAEYLGDSGPDNYSMFDRILGRDPPISAVEVVEQEGNALVEQDPITNFKTGVVEPEQQIQKDPWQGAYLSTLVRLQNGKTLQNFRSASGEKLTLPEQAQFLPYSSCSGVVRFPDRSYPVRCKKSSST